MGGRVTHLARSYEVVLRGWLTFPLWLFLFRTSPRPPMSAAVCAARSDSMSLWCGFNPSSLFLRSTLFQPWNKSSRRSGWDFMSYAVIFHVLTWFSLLVFRFFISSDIAIYFGQNNLTPETTTTRILEHFDQHWQEQTEFLILHILSFQHNCVFVCGIFVITRD